MMDKTGKQVSYEVLNQMRPQQKGLQKKNRAWLFGGVFETD